MICRSVSAIIAFLSISGYLKMHFRITSRAKRVVQFHEYKRMSQNYDSYFKCYRYLFNFTLFSIVDIFLLTNHAGSWITIFNCTFLTTRNKLEWFLNYNFMYNSFIALQSFKCKVFLYEIEFLSFLSIYSLYSFVHLMPEALHSFSSLKKNINALHFFLGFGFICHWHI